MRSKLAEKPSSSPNPQRLNEEFQTECTSGSIMWFPEQYGQRLAEGIGFEASTFLVVYAYDERC